jgi:hypothetical protein
MLAVICGVIAILVLCVFFQIRNEVVFNARGKAIQYIFKQDEWKALQNRLDSPSYSAMLFQIHKWTYKQFYPEFHQGSSELN